MISVRKMPSNLFRSGCIRITGVNQFHVNDVLTSAGLIFRIVPFIEVDDFQVFPAINVPFAMNLIFAELLILADMKKDDPSWK